MVMVRRLLPVLVKVEVGEAGLRVGADSLKEQRSLVSTLKKMIPGPFEPGRL
jgi:hypothetical protein